MRGLLGSLALSASLSSSSRMASAGKLGLTLFMRPAGMYLFDASTMIWRSTFSSSRASVGLGALDNLLSMYSVKFGQSALLKLINVLFSASMNALGSLTVT